MEVYLIYGITDCPACLRACADLMENNKEYVFIETDFSKTYRESIKKEFDWHSFPIIVRVDKDNEKLIGGYAELLPLLGPRATDPAHCPILKNE